MKRPGRSPKEVHWQAALELESPLDNSVSRALSPQERMRHLRRRLRIVVSVLVLADLIAVGVYGHHRTTFGAILVGISVVGTVGHFAVAILAPSDRKQLTPEELEALLRRLLKDIAAELRQFTQQPPRGPVYEHWLKISGKRLDGLAPALAQEWRRTPQQPAASDGLVSAAELRARRGLIEGLSRQVSGFYGEVSAAGAQHAQREPAAIPS